MPSLGWQTGPQLGGYPPGPQPNTTMGQTQRNVPLGGSPPPRPPATGRQPPAPASGQPPAAQPPAPGGGTRVGAVRGIGGGGGVTPPAGSPPQTAPPGSGSPAYTNTGTVPQDRRSPPQVGPWFTQPGTTTQANQMQSLFGNMFGGGGNFSGSFSGGGGQSFSPLPFHGTTQDDPRLSNVYNQQVAFDAQMAAQQDRDALKAMNSVRDTASGMAKEAREGAAFRVGADSGVGEQLASNALNTGLRAAADTRSNLASDARSQRQALMNSQANTASQIANVNNANMANQLAGWNASNQNAYNAASLQATQQNNAMNNYLQQMNMYTGLMGNLMGSFLRS